MSENRMPVERHRPPRVVWPAGTRGQILALGPVFLAVDRRSRERADGALHVLLNTGEQGMASQQALDALHLRPDETAPLCHPGDESAGRMLTLLERVEAFARQRKATRLVFTGCGPAAVAAALTCHARGHPGLWLRPADPTGQLGRLRLEAGHARIIEACAPLVSVWNWPEVPPGPSSDETWLPEAEIDGLRAGAPLALIAVQRREWGIGRDVTDRLARQAAEWAVAHPDVDWLILSTLNARIEMPVRSLVSRPSNLLLAPPLPCSFYRLLLRRSRLVLTDSARMGGEALGAGVGLALLADDAPMPPSGPWICLTPGDLENGRAHAAFADLIASSATRPVPPSVNPTPIFEQCVEAVEDWLMNTRP